MPGEGPVRAIRADFLPGDPILDSGFRLREKGLGWWLRLVLTDEQLTGSHQLQLSVLNAKEILSQTSNRNGLLHFGERYPALHCAPALAVDLRDDVWDVVGQNRPWSLIITSGKKRDTYKYNQI